MKALERKLSALRAEARSLRAWLGASPLPSVLVLRLDDLDAPPGEAPAGAPLDADGWLQAYTSLRTWAGAVPVQIVGRVSHPALIELARFAGRLDAPVRVRTAAGGLTREVAEALVSAGVRDVRVRVAGTSDAVQSEVLGEDVETARVAVAALLEARREAGARLEVRLEWVPSLAGAPELRGVFDQARRAALDGVSVAVPWTFGDVPPELRQALEWAALQRAPFHGTPAGALEALRSASAPAGEEPGRPRGAGRCGVHTRLELRHDGTVAHCPFKAGASGLEGGAAGAFAALAAQRAAVRACGRECAHPDLLGA